MCDEESNGIGDIVPDDRIIYRACSRSTFLTTAKDAASEVAFQKEGRNHKDGLSLALTPIDSISGLSKNHGIIRITVGDIHQLNRGLEVHFDTTDASHVIIRNLPCIDRGPEEKELALAVSAELAAIAEVESASPVLKPPAPTSASQ
jgi:hypothetical protein